MTKFALNIVPPWQSKAGFVLLIEFFEVTMKFLTLFIFFGTVQYFYGTPIHLFRRLFVSFRAFQRALSSVRDYYKFVRNINTLFPDATPDQLLEHPMCVICRNDEPMQTGKRLPCGHIFHANCLFGWLSSQAVCPTCRFSLHDIRPDQQQPQPQPQQQPQPQPPRQPQQPQPQAPGQQNQPQYQPNIVHRNEFRELDRTPQSQTSTSQPSTPFRSADPGSIENLERNIKVLREQLEVLSDILNETEIQLQEMKESAKQEKKQEPPEDPEDTEEQIPTALSPMEEMRQRRLLRFSNN